MAKQMRARGAATWKVQGPQKREAVQRLFAETAPSYDRVNSILTLRAHHRWRRSAVRMLCLQPGDSALDVCCGTGDFMTPLRKAVGSAGKVIGVDFCLPMLQLAKQKKPDARLSVGDACALPITSEAFDGVTVGWGIRNVSDIDAAHRELFRVLKPGGRFVSLDMARPQGKFLKSVSTWIFRRFAPFIGGLFGKSEQYRYLAMSTEEFADREKLADSMRRAGFIDVEHRDFLFGNICIHKGVRP